MLRLRLLFSRALSSSHSFRTTCAWPHSFPCRLRREVLDHHACALSSFLWSAPGSPVCIARDRHDSRLSPLVPGRPYLLPSPTSHRVPSIFSLRPARRSFSRDTFNHNKRARHLCICLQSRQLPNCATVVTFGVAIVPATVRRPTPLLSRNVSIDSGLSSFSFGLPDSGVNRGLRLL